MFKSHQQMVHYLSACSEGIQRQIRAARLRADDGQTTAEYALVLLGVAAIAMLLLTWARGTGAVTQLFDAVLDSVINLVP